MDTYYDLAADLEIKEMTLSSGGSVGDEEESVLILGDKPKGLENQDIYLRYAKGRSWITSPPQAFYADAGVFTKRRFEEPGNKLAEDGWTFKASRDIDGNKTIKKYYIEIKNTGTNQEYVGIPVTQNHFHAGVDPAVDNLLIVDKQSFLDNPNLAMSLNHNKIKVEAVDGRWIVAKNDPLADIIKLPGNSVRANNPETLYLLTEEELEQYNSDGQRKGWSEDPGDKQGLRSFMKVEKQNGLDVTVDRRFVKEIMIPQKVNGEEMPVKHYLMSDAKTLESIEIMEPTSKKDEAVSPEVADESTLMAESAAHFRPTDSDIITPVGEPDASREDQSQEEDMSEFEALYRSENPSQPEKQKVELTGLALEIAERLSRMNGGTMSALEKEFIEELNAIQDDPKKLKKAMDSIKNSPLHEGVMAAFALANSTGLETNPQDAPDSHGAPGVSGPQGKAETSVGGAEAVLGAAAGAGLGVVKGTFGAAKTLASGTMTAVNKIIENHHKRKQFRLENPEIVGQEKAASKERLMVARRARAEDSNSLLDARIESVLGSKQFIDQHPAVQQMYNMIEDNPTLKGELEGWLEDTAANNPVFAEHLKNVSKNAGSVARDMEENLKLNNLADADIGERKGKFEQFNESFTNDPLAEVLPDTGIEGLDGEQSPTIKESITKAINNMMKMLKDMMLRLIGKKKAGESAEQSDDAAPAMSR